MFESSDSRMRTSIYSSNNIINNNNLNSLQQQTNTMNPENSTPKIYSQHNLMTTFICFNSTHDKFITCGEEGEINVYVANKNRKIYKLSYANIFNDEAIVCIKWANINAGGKVALSGSKGSVAILSIDQHNGFVKVETLFREKTYNYSVLDMDWHPSKKILVCSTSQTILLFQQYGSFWNYSKLLSFPNQKEIRVCWGIQDQTYLFFSVNDKLYSHKSGQETLKELPHPIKQLHGETIKQIICRNQMNSSNYSQLLVLTKNKLRVWIAEEIRVFSNKTEQKINELQSIDLQGQNLSKSFWGWSQNELVCYPKSKSIKKKDNIDNPQNSYVIFKRMVSGLWERA